MLKPFMDDLFPEDLKFAELSPNLSQKSTRAGTTEATPRSTSLDKGPDDEPGSSPDGSSPDPNSPEGRRASASKEAGARTAAEIDENAATMVKNRKYLWLSCSPYARDHRVPDGLREVLEVDLWAELKDFSM